MLCITLANFCSEGKVLLLLSMVRYQVMLCFRNDTDTIAVNKLCKLTLWYFTMYLAISKQWGYQGFFKYGV